LNADNEPPIALSNATLGGGVPLSGASIAATEIAMNQLILGAVMASLPLAACSNLTPGQQRTLSGAAIARGEVCPKSGHGP
jgi:hypothetical protein